MTGLVLLLYALIGATMWVAMVLGDDGSHESLYGVGFWLMLFAWPFFVLAGVCMTAHAGVLHVAHWLRRSATP